MIKAPRTQSARHAADKVAGTTGSASLSPVRKPSGVEARVDRPSRRIVPHHQPPRTNRPPIALLQGANSVLRQLQNHVFTSIFTPISTPVLRRAFRGGRYDLQKRPKYASGYSLKTGLKTIAGSLAAKPITPSS